MVVCDAPGQSEEGDATGYLEQFVPLLRGAEKHRPGKRQHGQKPIASAAVNGEQLPLWQRAADQRLAERSGENQECENNKEP